MSAVSKLDVYRSVTEMEPSRPDRATFSFFILFKLEQNANGQRELREIPVTNASSVSEGETAEKVKLVSSDLIVSIPPNVLQVEGFVSMSVGAIYSLQSDSDGTLLRLTIAYTNHTTNVTETYRHIPR